MDTALARLREYTRGPMDHEHAAAVLGACARPTLFDAIGEILATTDADAVWSCLTFVRDVALGAVISEEKEAFRSALAASRFFDHLDSAASAPVYRIRCHAVYTFGKLSFPEQAHRLRALVIRCLAVDPMLLHRLLGELHWLEDDLPELFLALRSPLALGRWCAAAAQPRDDELALLLDDPDPRVRAEARHVAGIGPQPPVSFGALAMRFENGLQAPDYRPSDIVALCEALDPGGARIVDPLDAVLTALADADPRAAVWCACTCARAVLPLATRGERPLREAIEAAEARVDPDRPPHREGELDGVPLPEIVRAERWPLTSPPSRRSSPRPSRWHGTAPGRTHGRRTSRWSSWSRRARAARLGLDWAEPVQRAIAERATDEAGTRRLLAADPGARGSRPVR